MEESAPSSADNGVRCGAARRGAWQRPSRPRSRSAFQSLFRVSGRRQTNTNLGLANNIIDFHLVELRSEEFGLWSRRQMDGWNTEERIANSPSAICAAANRETSVVCCCACNVRAKNDLLLPVRLWPRGVPNANSHLLFRFYYKRKLFGQLQSCEGEAHAH